MGRPEDISNSMTLIQRSLKLHHSFITGGRELNASCCQERPTMFRALLFQTVENTYSDEDKVKTEDIVTLYHKQYGSFLHFDPDISKDPFFCKLCT